MRGRRRILQLKATHYSKEIGFEVVEGIVNKKKYINRASLLSKGNIREMFIVLTLPTEGRFAQDFRVRHGVLERRRCEKGSLPGRIWSSKPPSELLVNNLVSQFRLPVTSDETIRSGSSK